MEICKYCEFIWDSTGSSYPQRTECVVSHGEIQNLKAQSGAPAVIFSAVFFRLDSDYIQEQSCDRSPLVTILEGSATRWEVVTDAN